MPRVVSLIASATEIICALGCEDQLVGRSHECDYPPSVQRLPVCTEPKIDVAGSSREIDQNMKEVLRDGLSVYRVHTATLQRLQPELIVTQSHCEVCAVSESDVTRALHAWLGSRPQVVSLAPNDLADAWKSIQQVAVALHVSERGTALVQQLRQRVGEIAARAAQEPTHPSVACLEWIEPLMAAGNWMPELVALAGGENLFGEAGRHAPWMTWEELRSKDPEIIVVLPCGFEIDRTRREMSALTAKGDWNELRAVRHRRVYLADGNQFFNRPGPRLVESLEILAELCHPGSFHFGHQGLGWQQL